MTASHEVMGFCPADEAALLAFFRDVFDDVGFQLELGGKDRDLLEIPARYLAGGGAFLLAVRGGRVIGTVALRPIGPGVGELKRFYVRSEDRGRGVGGGLLAAALGHARAAGWARVRLDTSSRSPAAAALFRARGFVEIPRYNDDPFAEIFMERVVQG